MPTLSEKNAAKRLRLNMDRAGNFLSISQNTWRDDVTGEAYVVIFCEGQQFGDKDENVEATIVVSALERDSAQIDAHTNSAIIDFDTREAALKTRLGV